MELDDILSSLRSLEDRHATLQAASEQAREDEKRLFSNLSILLKRRVLPAFQALSQHPDINGSSALKVEVNENPPLELVLTIKKPFGATSRLSFRGRLDGPLPVVEVKEKHAREEKGATLSFSADDLGAQKVEAIVRSFWFKAVAD